MHANSILLKIDGTERLARQCCALLRANPCRDTPELNAIGPPCMKLHTRHEASSKRAIEDGVISGHRRNVAPESYFVNDLVNTHQSHYSLCSC